MDRSAAYATRWVAKNIVAAGLADRCEIQVAYAIGVAHPVSVFVETFGTEKVDPEKLGKLIPEFFDLRPAAIIRDLDLRRPIYRATAAYGHSAGPSADFTWESIHRAEELPGCTAALATTATSGAWPTKAGARIVMADQAPAGRGQGPKLVSSPWTSSCSTSTGHSPTGSRPVWIRSPWDEGQGPVRAPQAGRRLGRRPGHRGARGRQGDPAGRLPGACLRPARAGAGPLGRRPLGRVARRRPAPGPAAEDRGRRAARAGATTATVPADRPAPVQHPPPPPASPPSSARSARWPGGARSQARTAALIADLVEAVLATGKGVVVVAPEVAAGSPVADVRALPRGCRPGGAADRRHLHWLELAAGTAGRRRWPLRGVRPHARRRPAGGRRRGQHPPGRAAHPATTPVTSPCTAPSPSGPPACWSARCPRRRPRRRS